MGLKSLTCPSKLSPEACSDILRRCEIGKEENCGMLVIRSLLYGFKFISGLCENITAAILAVDV